MLQEVRRRALAVLQTLRQRREELERAPGLPDDSLAEGRKALDCMVDSAARLLESIDECLKQCGITPDDPSHERDTP